jgi:hypothetical protein
VPPSTRLFWVTALAVCLAIARAAHAEEAEAQPAPPAEAAAAAPAPEAAAAPPPQATAAAPKSELGMPEKPLIDMEHAETFMDVSEAIRSRQYVHRTILSTVIRATNKFATDRFYLNHIMGFSSIMQSLPPAKFSAGLQGLAGGWVSSGGHGFEVGVEVSAISNIYGGYRYFYKIDNFSLWPVFGIGAGYQVDALQLTRPPGFTHTGPVPPKLLTYAVIGLLIPMVDVGLRAEIRVALQGFSRIMLTQGLGIVVFL